MKKTEYFTIMGYLALITANTIKEHWCALVFAGISILSFIITIVLWFLGEEK